MTLFWQRSKSPVAAVLMAQHANTSTNDVPKVVPRQLFASSAALVEPSFIDFGLSDGATFASSLCTGSASVLEPALPIVGDKVAPPPTSLQLPSPSKVPSSALLESTRGGTQVSLPASEHSITCRSSIFTYTNDARLTSPLPSPAHSIASTASWTSDASSEFSDLSESFPATPVSQVGEGSARIIVTPAIDIDGPSMGARDKPAPIGSNILNLSAIGHGDGLEALHQLPLPNLQHPFALPKLPMSAHAAPSPLIKPPAQTPPSPLHTATRSWTDEDPDSFDAMLDEVNDVLSDEEDDSFSSDSSSLLADDGAHESAYCPIMQVEETLFERTRRLGLQLSQLSLGLQELKRRFETQPFEESAKTRKLPPLRRIKTVVSVVPTLDDIIEEDESSEDEELHIALASDTSAERPDWSLFR